LQAVVELAKHAVEQVPEGGAVAVAVGLGALVVGSGFGRVGHGHKRPGVADGGEAVIFDPPVGEEVAASGGAGDGAEPA
jgi:hypothetical protein